MTLTSLWHHLYLERSQSMHGILPSSFLLQVLRSYEKSEQVQQANVFIRQTLMFHFSRCRSNSCKYLSHHTAVWPHEGIDRCECDRCIGRWNNTATKFFLINNTFSTMSKLFTPNMYCWSCETLDTIYWMHLRLYGIYAKSFCPQQTNNRRLFLTATLRYLTFINDITVTSWQ